MSTQARAEQQFTAKGQATRARILDAAADLIYRRGVHGTNNDLLRQAAEVSGSQLNHYFPDKESLVLAVIGWQADRVIALHESAQFGGFADIDAFRTWADFYVGYEDAYQAGCSLGSLASEIIKTDLDVRHRLAAEFERWEEVFRTGLRRMRDNGTLRPDADPERLTHLIMAAFQGGMLLAQIAREVTPLRDALTGTIDYLETYAN